MNYNPAMLPHPGVYYASNGLKCIHVSDSSHPIICLQLYIKAGSAFERTEQSGYSHFIEHLVFKSTRQYPGNTISAVAQTLGGVFNAFTDFDCTCFYLILPSEYLNQGLNMLGQLAYAADFSRCDVRCEKDIIIEEIKQYQNDPESDFLDFVQRCYFKHSYLKHPVLGHPSSVRKASWNSLQQYYHDNYAPNNSFLIVSGDYEPVDLFQKLEEHFSSWHSASYPVPKHISLEPELRPACRIQRPAKSGTELLAFTLPELSESHPMSDALLCAMRWLAIGKSSRLYKRLVEEERLCSAVRVNSLSGNISGVSVIFTYPLAPKHCNRIEEIFYSELNILLANGVPEHSLEEIKTDLIHNWLFSFDGVENLANLCAAEEFIGDVNRLTRYGNLVASISTDQVLSAVRKYWPLNNTQVYMQLESTTPQRSSLDLSQFGKEEPIQSRPTQLISFTPQNHKAAHASHIHHIADGYCMFTLTNGLQVLHNRLPAKPTAGFALSSPLSQLHETEDQRGVNYFTSAMMLHRTRKYNHQDLIAYSRAHGLNIRAIHHLDSTTFRGKCMSTSLEEALALLGELMINASFDPGYLALLKSAAIDGIHRDNANPVSFAYQRWLDLLAGKKGNLSRTAGTISDIRKITIHHLDTWRAAQSLHHDYTLAVVSPHLPEQVYEMTQRYLGAHKSASSNISYKPMFATVKPGVKKEYRNSEQAIIHLGSWGVPAKDISANVAFYVLSQIIGGDGSSRMFDLIREEHGFAYQTGFDFTSLADFGIWNAYSNCEMENYQQCLDLMLQIILDIQTHGVSEQDVKNAVSYLLGMNRIDLESVSYRASSMSCLAALGYPPEHFLNRENRLKAVSLDQVNEVASKWLDPIQHYLHILL